MNDIPFCVLIVMLGLIVMELVHNYFKIEIGKLEQANAVVASEEDKQKAFNDLKSKVDTLALRAGFKL